jgi:hypothetical protein
MSTPTYGQNLPYMCRSSCSLIEDYELNTLSCPYFGEFSNKSSTVDAGADPEVKQILQMRKNDADVDTVSVVYLCAGYNHLLL